MRNGSIAGRLVLAATALALLTIGFAIEMAPPGRAAGLAVAQAIAALAGPILHLAGVDLVREGLELRSLSSGWAVRVGEVCDGMGLIVALLAVLLALAPKWRAMQWLLPRALLGIVAIQFFNLLRVVGLALALDRWPAGFGLLHDRLFPLLTVLVIGLALLSLRRLLLFGALVAGLELLWSPLAAGASDLLVPLANALLRLGPAEVGEIAHRAAGWSVGTLFLADTDPVRLFVAPLEPQHFTLAMPVVVAAVLLTRRPFWLVLALPLMLMALAVAAPVAVWALAETQAPVTLLRPDGAGAFSPEHYVPPEALRAMLRLAQNTLVHFLLLVLPFLALSDAGGHRAPR